MANALLISALVFIGIFCVLSMMIVHQVSKRGVKVNFLWLRLYIIKYIHEYGKLTRRETGKTGPLFWPCIISVNAALLSAVAGLVIKAL